MKIAIISTSDIRGGAAIAASRLFTALKSGGNDVRFLVRDKLSESTSVSSLDTTSIQRGYNFFLFILERLHYAVFMRSKELLFFFSPASVGRNIRSNKIIKDTDLVHLHWINQGFISLRGIKQLVRSGKKIVWTLHDMWAFTGGCHFSGECTNYQNSCGNCPFLRSPSKSDLSWRVWKRKKNVFSAGEICFVTCSHWLAERARESGLLGKMRIEVIPNPINTELYKPADQKSERAKHALPEDKFLILFGSANLNDKRKGFVFLKEALLLLYKNHPELHTKIGLVTFGKSTIGDEIPFALYDKQFITDEETIASLYQCADVFMLPSLQDNLPNTIMESLASGTPVVAFKTGGIPEMISHGKTGYLADYKSPVDLYNGIKWIVNHKDPVFVRSQCREKVLNEYSEKIISSKYYALYNSLLSNG
jgi:glycosyltransferase involved in cell wall biosynthesis